MEISGNGNNSGRRAVMSLIHLRGEFLNLAGHFLNQLSRYFTSEMN